MEVSSYEDGQQWLIDHNIPLDLNGHYEQWKDSLQARFRIPGDSGFKTGLARCLVSELFAEQETIFLVTETDVWPSSELPYVFLKYRQGHGVDRPLSESKFHLFGPDECEALGGAIALSLYFVWGFLLTDVNLSVIIHASHDEYIECWTRDPETYKRCDAMFAEYDMERLSGPLL
jgi:hypothetical protein